ncbi:hypothetical protein EP331_12990 [bacterium]|nr:MAG: hypothetical protein EP331_12990 [bacterium]
MTFTEFVVYAVLKSFTGASQIAAYAAMTVTKFGMYASLNYVGLCFIDPDFRQDDGGSLRITLR